MPAVQSSMCRRDHFYQPWYQRWSDILLAPTEVESPSTCYRKFWEWAAILDALQSRGKLKAGMKGLGFAVGTEPLSSIFARYGVDVLASDLADGNMWAETAQHAASRDALFVPRLIGRSEFEARVSFQPVDMADLSGLPSDTYDFLWSSCSLEHVGSMSDGLDFVVNAMRLLKPGGVATHTTEFNVASNDETLTDRHMCVYRKRDFEELDYRLRRIRCGMEPMDMTVGTHPHDLNYDTMPYFQSGGIHIKLDLLGHIATSCLIIVHKGS